MQGAFFIFHLLTKPFPSRDQPPIHLNHMTNHLTSHLTTHMTSHMPFQSPAPKSPAHHLILPHLTSHDPKPFLSRDQPPIHLDHMTNHLTSHLTTHMTSHMPFQSPAPKSPAYHLILPHLTSHDPIPTPDSSLFTYLSLASGFLACLLYFLHSLISQLILTPFLLPSRVSQFRSI